MKVRSTVDGWVSSYADSFRWEMQYTKYSRVCSKHKNELYRRMTMLVRKRAYVSKGRGKRNVL
jgi:hypothetical protein